MKGRSQISMDKTIQKAGAKYLVKFGTIKNSISCMALTRWEQMWSLEFLFDIDPQSSSYQSSTGPMGMRPTYPDLESIDKLPR